VLNKNSIWKVLSALIVVAVCALYALPNIYGEDHAVQISAGRDAVVTDATVEQVKAALSEKNISPKRVEFENEQILVRVSDSDTQLVTRETLEKALGDDYYVAMNLAPDTPEWLEGLGGAPMKLGLDLRGGVHFLMEVDIDKALEQRHNGYVSEIKQKLREEKIRYRTVKADLDSGIRVVFKNAESRDKATDMLRDSYRDFLIRDIDDGGDFNVVLTLTERKVKEIQDYAISQNLTTIRNRVNELGVAEPLVQRQGASRIVVELPGVQDTATAKRILGRTATLEFRIVDWEHDASAAIAGVGVHHIGEAGIGQGLQCNVLEEWLAWTPRKRKGQYDCCRCC